MSSKISGELRITRKMILECIDIACGVGMLATAIGVSPNTLTSGLVDPGRLSVLTKAKLLEYGRRSRLWGFELDSAFDCDCIPCARGLQQPTESVSSNHLICTKIPDVNAIPK